MNYIKLWKQAKNSLILNDSIKLMKQIEQNFDIKFVRVRIKSWNELANSYELNRYDGSSIYIDADSGYFTRNMQKFCGEEFEIVMMSSNRILFWIINGNDSWAITKHMVDIIKSKDSEINKNWPMIQMPVRVAIETMWQALYDNCKKSEKNILAKLAKIDYELNRKKVKVKSLEQLMTEGVIHTNGNITIREDWSVFNYDMYSLCGEEFMAEYRDDSYIIGHLSNNFGYWTITRGMVTEI